MKVSSVPGCHELGDLCHSLLNEARHHAGMSPFRQGHHRVALTEAYSFLISSSSQLACWQPGVLHANDKPRNKQAHNNIQQNARSPGFSGSWHHPLLGSPLN